MYRHRDGFSSSTLRSCARLVVEALFVVVIVNISLASAQDHLVLLSPHWKGIEDEFERGFKAHYLRETGRAVALEWLDVGGTSEVLRFIRSEFSNKPAGIGIDILFGGGLEPYLALKKEKLLRPYVLPHELLKNIPQQLGVCLSTIRITRGTGRRWRDSASSTTKPYLTSLNYRASQRGRVWRHRRFLVGLVPPIRERAAACT